LAQSPLQHSAEVEQPAPSFKQLPFPVKTPGVSPPSPVLVDELELPESDVVEASPPSVSCRLEFAVPHAAAHTVVRETRMAAAVWATTERRDCDRGRSIIEGAPTAWRVPHGRERRYGLISA
jgi:hypothetical protein